MRRVAGKLDASLPVVTLLALLAAWEGFVRALGIKPIVFPPPSLVLTELGRGLRSGVLVRNAETTLLETFAGFAIAAVLGIALGTFVAESSFGRRAVYPYIIGFQTVPKIALAPILVIWFGFGISSKIVVAVTVAIFPVIVNTIEGLRNTDHERVEMIRAMGASRWETFRRVKFPSALPFIFAGLDAAIVFSLLGAIVGEFIGSRSGLGNLILTYNAVLNIAGSFAVLLLLSVLGYGLHLLLVMVQKRVVFWTRQPAAAKAPTA